MNFKVIEFNKDAKRIILSHSRIHEDAQRAAAPAEEVASEPKKVTKKATKEETPSIEKTTLGDIDVLSNLKDKMVAKATEAMIAKEAAKTDAAPVKKTTKKVAKAETAETTEETEA